MRPVFLYFCFVVCFLIGEANAKPSPQVSQQWTDSLAAQAEIIADTYHQMGWFSGTVLLAKEGKVVFEKSYGFANLADKTKNTSNTKYNLGSIIKNFTKVLVLQQVENGNLSLDDTLSRFELGFPKTVSSKITIQHLLHHRSGFDDIFIAEYREEPLAFDTLEKKLALLKNKPLLFEPGTDQMYSNYGYIVLGAILEKVTGQAFEELVNNNIFKRLGLENVTLHADANDNNQSIRYSYIYDGSLRKVGVTEHPSPDGGIESTAADVLTFYRELFYGNKLLDRAHSIVRKEFAMDGKHWGSYGGGAGVSAAVEVNLEDQIEVVVLANTDSLIAERISGRIHSFAKTGDYSEIAELETNFTYRVYRETGKDVFFKHFKQEYEKKGYRQFIGRTVNELGMQLLKNESWDEAFDIFNYLKHIFPNAPQAYDSLAFAYLSKGKKREAKKVFSKALELNSEFVSDYVSDNYGNDRIMM